MEEKVSGCFFLNTVYSCTHVATVGARMLTAMQSPLFRKPPVSHYLVGAEND